MVARMFHWPAKNIEVRSINSLQTSRRGYKVTYLLSFVLIVYLLNLCICLFLNIASFLYLSFKTVAFKSSCIFNYSFTVP